MAYVYTHTRLDTNEIFYVGIGKDSNGKYERAKESNKRNLHWKRICKKTKRIFEIVADNLTWKEACEIEVYLIMFFGRKDLSKGKLCNLTHGGDGSNGRIKLADELEKLRVANIGRKHTPETLEKMRVARIGRKLSETHKQKIRANSTGRPHTNEAKRKISLANTGRKWSKESIDKNRSIKALNKKSMPQLVLW